MTWWQILLVFVGIPAAAFFLRTVVVLRFPSARVPDGLLRAADEEQAGDDQAPEDHGNPGEGDFQDD